jgi:hypothetical protein
MIRIYDVAPEGGEMESSVTFFGGGIDPPAHGMSVVEVFLLVEH